MRKRIGKGLSLLLCMALIFTSLMIPASAGVPPTDTGYTVTDIKVLTNPIREENYFQVEVKYHVTLTNHGWDSQVWHACGSCGGSGQVARYGGGSGNTHDVYLVCGQSFQGRTWKCRSGCDGYDYLDVLSDRWGEVTHDTNDPWDEQHTNNWEDGRPHIWDVAGRVNCTCSMPVHINDAPANSGMITCRGCGGLGEIFVGMEKCNSCGGDGSVDDYKDCPVCKGTGKDCGNCDHTGKIPNGSHKCGNCGGTGEVKVFVRCEECGGSGEVSAYITCDSCGGSGGTYVTVHHDPLPPPDKFNREIDIQLNGTVQKKKTVTFNMTTTEHDSWVWTKEGTHTEIWDVYADSDIGDKTVASHIQDGNTLETPVKVIPATNLQVEFVQPNAYYRAGTEVVSTFRIRNEDNIGELNIRPRHNLTATFQAVNASGQSIATGTKSGIVIPRKGTNLVYFKWKVPEGYSGNVKLTCKVNTTKVAGTNGVPGVNEMDYNDNSVTATCTVKERPVMETPNTVFENTPSWFRKPTASDKVDVSPYSKNVLSSASYQMWEWDSASDWYKLKNYSINLSAPLKLTPDVNSPSHKLVDEVWQMKSGYGISAQLTPKLTGTLPSADAYTKMQTANAHLPEYRYSNAKDKWRSLELSGDAFTFRENPNAKDDKGRSDNRRIHFTPLWYPDGTYKVEAYGYDVWTPAGMLSVVSDDQVTIQGNMYDDWYISHSQKK